MTTEQITALLAKYIQYIREVEGTDYITMHDSRQESSVQFTEQEWKTLGELAKMK